jgi:8-oxo-dGTP pyrophosphatase MutT (NUDIX family)
MKYRVSIPEIGDFETDHPQRDALALENARRTALLIEDFGEFAFNRANDTAHITGSAFILSQDRSHILLMHHAKLDRWLQPGGHCDLEADRNHAGKIDVRATALREASEETGISDLRMLDGAIFDVDIHEIPARGQEPAHLHYDIRFLFEADASRPIQRNSESKQIAWVSAADMDRLTSAPSVLIAARAMTG